MSISNVKFGGIDLSTARSILLDGNKKVKEIKLNDSVIWSLNPEENEGSGGDNSGGNSSTETCVDCGGNFNYPDDIIYRTDDDVPSAGYYCYTCSSKYN